MTLRNYAITICHEAGGVNAQGCEFSSSPGRVKTLGQLVGLSARIGVPRSVRGLERGAVGEGSDEPLAVQPRPGNASSNTAAHHIAVTVIVRH